MAGGVADSKSPTLIYTRQELLDFLSSSDQFGIIMNNINLCHELTAFNNFKYLFTNQSNTNIMKAK